MILPSHWHRWIYLGGLALVAIGLPFSTAFMSIGELLIAANFLLEGKYQERIQALIKKRSALLFVSIFVLHVIGLAWTCDFQYALEDLRIKLPLLLFPIVIPLSAHLKRKEFDIITGLFCVSVIITSFFSTYNYVVHIDDPGFDFRKISMFTSHIRYSLMVCMAYLILLNRAWNEDRLALRLFYTLLAAWLSVFVFLLQSMTGIVLWIVSGYILLVYTFFFMEKAWTRSLGLFTLICIPIAVGTYLYIQVDDYYPDEMPDVSTFPSQTTGGEFYGHDSVNLMLENGHLIHSNVALTELSEAWNSRSDIPFNGGVDGKGQFVSSTLIRYMTSKGLNKDSVGVSKLTDQDVKAIESGIANVRYLEKNPISNRIYTIIWEYEKMKYEQSADGHSVTQRFIYWMVGWNIFESNPIIGVGTGDVSEAFQKSYDEMEIPLKERFRLRAHNQFLTIGLTFGVLGFLLFLSSLVYPFLKVNSANTFLYIGFFIIAIGSMMNEDTLETQAGVTFYAFFNALLLYSRSSRSEESEERISE